MEWLEIRFGITFKNGNETFQIMNNLPVSMIKDANLTLLDGASTAYKINKSAELEYEYQTDDNWLIPTDNEKLLFEKFVGAEAKKIKDSINKIQDAKLDNRFCELEQEGVEFTNNLARETRKEFPLVVSVEATIYKQSVDYE